jgi:hypothetical protein
MEQGCQIFLDTIYQNGGKYTQLPLNYQNCHKIYHMAAIHSKRPKNIPTFSIPGPSKIYPNWVFGLKICHLATPRWRGKWIFTQTCQLKALGPNKAGFNFPVCHAKCPKTINRFRGKEKN